MNAEWKYAAADDVAAAEGVNVMRERRTAAGTWQYSVTNIEYTEFERLGLRDEPVCIKAHNKTFTQTQKKTHKTHKHACPHAHVNTHARTR